MTSLLGSKPKPEAVAELVGGMFDRHKERRTVMRAMHRLYESEEDVERPEGVEDTSIVHSGIPAQVVGLLKGLLSDDPKVKAYTGAKRGEVKKAVEGIESSLNTIYQVLEQQQQPVFDPLMDDILKFGVGCDAQEFLSETWGKGMPQREKYGYKGDDTDPEYKVDEYDEARSDRIRGMSLGHCRLPIAFRNVPIGNFFWEEGGSGGPLELAVEVRQRTAKSILEDERHKGHRGIGGLRKYWEKQNTANPKTAALTAMCRYLVIEDAYWRIEAVLPGAFPAMSGTTGSGDTAKRWSDADWADVTLEGDEPNLEGVPTLEILSAVPNPIGRPRYTLTRGLTTTSPKLAYRNRSVFFDARHLLRNYDAGLTWKLLRLKAGLFSPAIAKRMGYMQNGVMTFGSDAEQGGEREKIQLYRGMNQVTELPDGVELYFAELPGGAPDEAATLAEMRQHIELLTLTSKLLNASGDTAGYLYNSLVATVLLRYKSILKHVRRSAVQRALLTLAIVEHEIEEPLPIGVNNPDSGEMDFYEIDPADFRAAQINLEGRFEIVQDQNLTQVLDNFARMTAGGTRAFTTIERARAVAGLENSAEIDEELAIQEGMQTPDVQKVILAEATKKVGILVEREEAEEQGDFDLQDLLDGSQMLSETLSRLVPPGAPGWEAAQQYQAGAGIGGTTEGQPPPPNGVPGGMMPPGMEQGVPEPAASAPTGGMRPALPGGRVAGAAGNPGGRRMKGGLG